MGTRKYHAIADLFPLMQGDEFEQLKADIGENGLRESICLHPDGSIIDGRNRYRACVETGVEPHFCTWDGKGSLVAFVVSMNLHRRHLTQSQRATIGVEVERQLAVEAKQQQGARTDLFVNLQKGSVPLHAAKQAAVVVGVSQKYISDAKKLKREAPKLFEQVKAGAITISQAKRERQKIERKQTAENILAALPEGKYQCIVIDPPWPTQKILREERPNQDLFDYPTMTVEEISHLPIGDLAHEEGCHIYLWTTHKFLPAALGLFAQWGVKYQCLMTWVKPTGMTPFSWMYDTEHILFGRVGTLKLLRMGLKLSFAAPVTKHSEKPNVFYERVCQVSPGPRLEMFARKPRDGFTVWGNEI